MHYAGIRALEHWSNYREWYLAALFHLELPSAHGVMRWVYTRFGCSSHAAVPLLSPLLQVMQDAHEDVVLVRFHLQGSFGPADASRSRTRFDSEWKRGGHPSGRVVVMQQWWMPAPPLDWQNPSLRMTDPMRAYQEYATGRRSIKKVFPVPMILDGIE